MLGWLLSILRHIWETPANVIAFVAAGAGALAAWYTRVQARAAAQQLELSQDQARGQTEALKAEAERTTKALAIAERSTKAAEMSAEATRSIAEIGQKAWVSLSAIMVEKSSTGDGGEQFVVTARLRNAGISPALAVAAVMRLEYLEHPPDTIAPALLDDTNAGFLGPGETLQLGPLWKALTRSEWRDSEHTLCAYGICRYKDIFDHSRHTRWCFRYAYKTGQFEPWTSQLNTMD